MKTKIIFLKLGGSLITHKEKPFSADIPTIKRLTQEIHEARKQKKFLLVLGHGGGSFPHVPAFKYGLHLGMRKGDGARGFAETQDAASRLNRIVIKNLLDAGEDAVSVSPSSCVIARNGKPRDFFYQPMLSMLKQGILPVIYGDVVIDGVRGSAITSTEQLLSSFSSHVKPDKLIMATRVDGVYTANPNEDKRAKMITHVNENNFGRVKLCLSGSSSTDVTGGMAHKVCMLVDLANLGVSCEIAGGMINGNIRRALLNEPHVATKIAFKRKA